MNESAKDMKTRSKRTAKRKDHPMQKGGGSKRTSKLIVHNTTDYQLTHLLEHGHPLKGWGQIEQRKAPHPHLLKKRVIREFLEKIEKAIER